MPPEHTCAVIMHIRPNSQIRIDDIARPNPQINLPASASAVTCAGHMNVNVISVHHAQKIFRVTQQRNLKLQVELVSDSLCILLRTEKLPPNPNLWLALMLHAFDTLETDGVIVIIKDAMVQRTLLAQPKRSHNYFRAFSQLVHESHWHLCETRGVAAMLWGILL